MSIPLSKGKPNWLFKQDPNDPGLNKKYRRSVLYYQALYAAWPDWCSNDFQFKLIYGRAKIMRSRGCNVHVDHIVPIINPLVCGLHVPWNLTYLTEKQNLCKSNKWWTDHPFENKDLFEDC